MGRNFVLTGWIIVALVMAVIVLLLFVAYFVFGYVVYTRLANVRGSCDMHLANRPDHFTNITEWPVEDFSPFFMPGSYETVRFPSRDAGLQLSGWYVQGDPSAPAIIVVDGLGGCKYAQATLVPAGILWRDGFSVLMIDLRNTGDSDSDNGYSAVGNKEYQDVLGAWDWLIQEKGFAPEQIGILGNSLGAAAVLFAFQAEPRIAAIALNSPFANLPQIIREEMKNNGFPGFLAPASVLMGKLVSGENLVERDPIEALKSAGDRPVWILHSTGDTRIGVHHSYQFQAAAQQAGINATFWFVDDIAHIRVPGVLPEEFRARLGDFFRLHLGVQ
jgi:dipeptidyl aminopeptidase/acylaminoacyl peptidase